MTTPRSRHEGVGRGAALLIALSVPSAVGGGLVSGGASAGTPERSSLADTGARSAGYEVLKRPARGYDLERRFGAAELAILEKLNRADVRHLGTLDMLVLPLQWDRDELTYSPFPEESAWAAAHSRALIVYQPAQAFGGYEQGRLVRWGPMSSGRQESPTPSGLFHLTWKSRGRYSTENPDWYLPWYFNFENDRGLSFHQYRLPGKPASHACIRLLARDARWLFDWGREWRLGPREWTVVEPGTPVLILGHYRFDAPPPWRSLEWLEHGIDLGREEAPHVLEQGFRTVPANESAIGAAEDHHPKGAAR